VITRSLSPLGAIACRDRSYARSAGHFGRPLRSFGTAYRSFGIAHPSFGTAYRSFGTAYRSFGTAYRSFGTAYRSFGTAYRSFGTAYRSFCTAHPSFGTAHPSFGMAYQSFIPAYRGFDLASRSLDLPGRDRGRPTPRPQPPCFNAGGTPVARFPNSESEIAALALLVTQGLGDLRPAASPVAPLRSRSLPVRSSAWHHTARLSRSVIPEIREEPPKKTLRAVTRRGLGAPEDA